MNRQPRIKRRISKRFGGCGSNPSQQQRPRDGRNAISGSWSRRRDLRLWRRALVGARRISRASAFGKRRAFCACSSFSRKSFAVQNAFCACSSFSRKSFAVQNLCGSPAISPPGCSVCALLSCCHTIRAQTVCSRKRLHPQIPSMFVTTKKRADESQLSFPWSRRRDLNPRPLGPEALKKLKMTI